MTRFQKLVGIAVVAFVVGSGMGVAVQAARSPSPTAIARAKLAEGLKVAEASRTTDGSKHSCVDLKEGTFEWRWANVPFASTCDAKAD
jgi:hypothetical protein